MFSLPPYVKDTTDFLNKVKKNRCSSKDTYLVTLDVSSLYTNIPTMTELAACEHLLQQNPNGNKLSSGKIAKLH